MWWWSACAGATTRRNATTDLSLLSKQGRSDQEVYRTVYLDPLETGWEKLSTDRTRPLRDRLLKFYRAYIDAIFARKWLRIYLCSGLKGLDINRWYVGMVKDKILTRIMRECRREVGLAVQSKPCMAESSITASANTSTGLPCSKTRSGSSAMRWTFFWPASRELPKPRQMSGALR